MTGRMGMGAVDLQAYCARIGYAGPLEPTLPVLRALHALHPAAIPFENLDVLLGRGVDIAPGAIDAKLIGARRGGYCYEHNGLFKRVLAAIGFAVEGHGARVTWNLPAGASPRPRTHMALRVVIEGEEWLADVGFGGCVPTAPLRFGTAEPQATDLETFRLLPAAGGYVLELRTDQGWTSMYELSLETMLDVDYELGNWYVSAHPDSHFRHMLIASRVTPAGRANLMDARLTIRAADGSSEQRMLGADALRAALRDIFGLPIESDWEAVIARAAERGDL